MSHQVADHYVVLGLEVGAGKADIKKAYHKLALECHPDRAGGKADGERFKEISEAYEALVDSKGSGVGSATFGQEVVSSEDEEDRVREHDKRRRKSWTSAKKRTPSMGPGRSPSFSPRSPGQTPAPTPRSWCRIEVIISLLVATLFLLLSSSSVSHRSPTQSTSTAPTSSLKPVIAISGSCPESREIIEGQYTQVGMLLGRPWYRKKPSGSILYYDSSCDGTSKSPSGWFIMDSAKADEFSGPTFGAECGTTARIPWDGSQLPFGSAEWEVACESAAPTRVNLTIAKVRV